MKFYLLLFSFFLFACGNSNSPVTIKNQSEQNRTEESELIIKKINGNIGWKSEINIDLSNELNDTKYDDIFNLELNQNDLNLLGCNNYHSFNLSEKKRFIIVFLAAIAERESDFDPENMTYDPTHKNWNIGLLQIDTKSAIRHAGESLSEEELKDPFLNLKVGLSIFKNQVTGKYRSELNGRLFTGKSFYWEVLNDNYKHRVIKSFINNRFNLPLCQNDLNLEKI